MPSFWKAVPFAWPFRNVPAAAPRNSSPPIRISFNLTLRRPRNLPPPSRRGNHRRPGYRCLFILVTPKCWVISCAWYAGIGVSPHRCMLLATSFPSKQIFPTLAHTFRHLATTLNHIVQMHNAMNGKGAQVDSVQPTPDGYGNEYTYKMLVPAPSINRLPPSAGMWPLVWLYIRRT